MRYPKITVVFNGRNAQNIAREAQAQFPDHQVVILRDEYDAIPAPEGYPESTLAELDFYTGSPEGGWDADEPCSPESVILVANGGQTRQQVRTVLMLVGLIQAATPLTGWDPHRRGYRYLGKLAIVDMQPDGTFPLYERDAIPAMQS